MTEDKNELRDFLEAVGLTEEPMGMFYSDQEPPEGVTPKFCETPSAEKEARNEINWGEIQKSWSCVIGKIYQARKKQTAAYFDKEHFGCMGGAFYLGFIKPQLESIVRYVSTGAPGMEGELYLKTPEAVREFFDFLDPPPAPRRYAVFQPMSMFKEGQNPELITFFARPEVISGLHQLVGFVTGDYEAVMSPWGAGCSSIVTWPLLYQAKGKLKAVIGGWDPSCRIYLKGDEITFTVPNELYRLMLDEWRDSFITANAWKKSLKKAARSRRVWGEDG